LGEVLDLVHQRYPRKPIFISEFGLRDDKARSADDRRGYFREAIDVMRQRPFIAGASVWTFQDYRSRYPDTAANGYRPWGVVDHLRVPRDAYHVVAGEFAAARVVAAPMSRVGGRLIARVSVEARPDFPARPVTGLIVEMRWNGAATPIDRRPLPDLVPGQRVEVTFERAGEGASGPTSIQIIRRDGSVMHRVDMLDSSSSAGAASR
jgi:beta-glucuronidase